MKIPYGDEWKRQMQRHTKHEIIEILGGALMRKDEQIAALTVRIKKLTEALMEKLPWKKKIKSGSVC